MILSLLLFCFLLILLLRNYTKGVTQVFVLSTFLSHFVMLGHNVFTYISLIALVLYFFNNSLLSTLQWRNTPTFIPLLIAIVSILLSNFWGYSSHTLIAFSVIASNIVLLLIMYATYKKHPQTVTSAALRTSLIYGFVIGSYALFETVTRSNPYIDMVNALGSYTDINFIEEIRYGLKRSQSIFSMHTTSGAVCIVLFSFLLVAKKMKYLNSRFATITIALLFFACIATGSRSVIFGIMVCLFMFFKGKYMMPKYWIPIIMILLFSTILFGSYIDSIVSSFINTENTGGSNVDMREQQLEISLYYWERSFWVGNGLFYTFEHALKQTNELLGAESLWFPIMIDQGALGMLAYISFFVASIFYCIKKRCVRVCYFVLGMLACNTLSSLPKINVLYSIFYVVIMVDMIKRSNPKMGSINSQFISPKHVFRIREFPHQ